MCRNIRPLFNYDPPATREDMREAALQFVRKVSGFHDPSELNKEVFDKAVNDVSEIVENLLEKLTTKAPPRNRAEEIEKAKERSKERFGR